VSQLTSFRGYHILCERSRLFHETRPMSPVRSACSICACSVPSVNVSIFVLANFLAGTLLAKRISSSAYVLPFVSASLWLVLSNFV
jgi:hypothetical protein